MSDFLSCPKCGDLANCVCPDRDKSLHDIAYDPNSHVVFKWCRKCDKHYLRCKCEVPEFFIIHAGMEIQIPKDGFRQVTGGRFIPDLKSR